MFAEDEAGGRPRRVRPAVGEAVTTVCAPGRCRDRPRLRRRDEQDRLRHLHPPPAVGFELDDVPRATPADLDAFPAIATGKPTGRDAALYAARLPRPIAYEHPELLRRDLHAPRAIESGSPGRRVHERALARRHRAVPAQRVLRATDEYLAAIGGGDARPSTRRSSAPASCCRSMRLTSRWAATSCTATSSDDVFVTRGARMSRRSTHALRDVSRPTGCACTCAGVTTKARIISTSPWRRSSA